MWLAQSVFLEVSFLTFLALHTKRKRCGQVGSTPYYSQSQVVSACQRFGPVAPFLFSDQSTIFSLLSFFNTERGVCVWPYRYSLTFPNDTDSKYIRFVDLALLFFSGKIPFLAFLIRKGIWSYRYTYYIPLVTLMIPTPYYSQSQVVSACQNFRPVASFFLLSLLGF